MEDMKPKKIDERRIEEEFTLLQETANFLKSLYNRKNAELENIVQRLEHEYNEELYARYEAVQSELKHIKLKMKYEQGLCENFDRKIQKLNNQKNIDLMMELSKKILNKKK